MRRRVVCPRSHPASLYVWGLFAELSSSPLPREATAFTVANAFTCRDLPPSGDATAGWQAVTAWPRCGEPPEAPWERSGLTER
jgi:hypothetical protein